jgi:uncharacterized phage-associated protein
MPTPTPASPPSALDVAELILQELGPLDGLKLQKLVYYVQALGLASRGRAVFQEPLQAWIHGPVVSELWQMHAGFGSQGGVVTVGGNTGHLAQDDRTLVKEVLAYYGQMTGLELRKLTHDEEPWKAARGDLLENQPGATVIEHESMREYYATRPWGGGKPMTDLSVFSTDRVRQAQREISEGKVVILSPGDARAIAS